jgi:hypothetical protein
LTSLSPELESQLSETGTHEPDEPFRHQHVYPFVWDAAPGEPVPRVPAQVHCLSILHIFAARAPETAPVNAIAAIIIFVRFIFSSSRCLHPRRGKKPPRILAVRELTNHIQG